MEIEIYTRESNNELKLKYFTFLFILIPPPQQPRGRLNFSLYLIQ